VLGCIGLGIALVACGDRCERLCDDVSTRLQRCRTAAWTWEDLGADNRAGFVSNCRRDWDETIGELGSHEIQLALDVCDASGERLDELTCEELTALYGAGD
jgi:hypothetical protein